MLHLPAYRSVVLLWMVAHGVYTVTARGAEVDFAKAIAPILERSCVRCHHSANGEPESGLDLTTAGSIADLVVAGQPDASTLLEVVSGDKPRMPQGGPPLAAAEIATLRQWIAAGAAWPEGLTLRDRRGEWWSLQPLAAVTPPDAGTLNAWCQNPVDRFIAAGLTAHNLTPAAPADRRTLIRRLYFDITGLPPSAAEVAAFVADPDPLAYEKLVDRLLADPGYGERWGRHWLDVVKYADTCGYDKDKLRPNAWPYRDYVIRSLNDDKPYAQFVREQVAGDALYPGQPDGILGLGFLAAGPWDHIGHVEVPESKIDGKVARNLDRDDVVSNVLNTFCSITIQCARCHDHKFDPITQQHYYALQAVFAAVDRADRPYDLDPAIEQQRQELQQQLASQRDLLARLDRAVKDEAGPRLAELDRELADLRTRVGGVVKSAEFGYHSALAASADTAKWVEIDLGGVYPVAQILLRPCHDEFAGIGAGFGFPVRFRVDGSVDKPTATPEIALADETGTDYANPGLTAYRIDTAAVPVRYVRITATRLAERKSDYMLALAEIQILDAAGTNLAAGGAVAALDSIEAPPRWQRANLLDGRWASYGDETAAATLAAREKERADLWAKVDTATRQRERTDLQTKIAELTAAVAKLPAGQMVYAAATHFTPQGNFRPTEGKPRPIHLLARGEVTRPTQAMEPGVPPLGLGSATALPLSEGHAEHERRAALADWLTRPDHPLTWRSIANRIWQYHFGRGLVDSPNDFGRMGELPTHLELLDYLARLIRDRQSLKAVHRLLLTSAVYQQSSEHRDAMAAADGENRWYWRMNRRRLEAEEVRDAMLAASGRLDRTLGGPGYFLFVLEKTEHSPHYEYHLFDSADPKSHRRSVYRFVVRSQPDPYMTTLDCADSSQSTPQRLETLTPQQALALLNNRFVLTMAELFAADLERGPGDPIAAAYARVVGRPPSADELAGLRRYADEHGLANLCRVLMNLSEFVFID